MNKEKLIFLLKLVVAICTAFLSVLGVSVLSSCTTSRDVSVKAHSVTTTCDTIHTYRFTNITYPKH